MPQHEDDAWSFPLERGRAGRLNQTVQRLRGSLYPIGKNTLVCNYLQGRFDNDPFACEVREEMMKRACIAAMICVATCSMVSAANVQSLYSLCKADEGSQEFGICVGYISGVAHLMQFLGVDLQKHPERRQFAICTGGSASNGAFVQAFKTWADRNPRHWGDTELIGVMVALVETWPCV